MPSPPASDDRVRGAARRLGGVPGGYAGSGYAEPAGPYPSEPTVAYPAEPGWSGADRGEWVRRGRSIILLDA